MTSVAIADDALPADAAPAPAPTDPAMVPPAPSPAPPAPAVMQQMSEEKSFAKNAIYAELAGNGGFYTINYERFLREDASIRVGAMYMSISVSAGSGQSMAESSGTWMTFPVLFEYTGIRSGAHALNLGAGMDFFYFSGSAGTFDATASSSGVLPAATVDLGYRYSDPKGGFLFKIAYTPFVFVTAETQTFSQKVQHWAGLSFGWRFGNS
ncbi:MAG: hypothetical protein AB7T06_23065 [Kofleriaceae bacterium]